MWQSSSSTLQATSSKVQALSLAASPSASPRTHDVQQRHGLRSTSARHHLTTAKHRAAVEREDERAHAAWASQQLLPHMVVQQQQTPRRLLPRFPLLLEPRVPLKVPIERCRPPPFRPAPRPFDGDEHGGAFITAAELAALPAHIQASFELEPIDEPVFDEPPPVGWTARLPACRPARMSFDFDVLNRSCGVPPPLPNHPTCNHPKALRKLDYGRLDRE